MKLKSIKKVSNEPTRCISLDNEEGLYVTDDYIITHNSTLTVCTNLYIAALFGLMRKPYQFYGGAASSIYTICFGSYSQKKADELLLSPLFQVLRASSFFEPCRTYKDMLEANKEFETLTTPKIFWTTADRTSPLSMSNGLNFKVVSSIGDIIGQNVVLGSCTELGFWRENGWTDEQIYGFFQSLRQRITSRMRGNRISGFILDSSPNTLESPIDKWIFQDAPKDRSNYLFFGPNWKFYRHNYEGELDSDGNVIKNFEKAFPLFKGGNGMMPRVVENENDLTQFDPIDLIWCPKMNVNVNMKDMCREDPIRFMKDWCGLPSGSADRIFYNPQTIEDVFDNDLRSINGELTAPAEEEPEHLIWNQIRDKFFNNILGKYYYYYEPNIPRAIAIDQSYAGDVTGISVVHVERSEDKIDSTNNEPLWIYVVDFSITIVPKGGLMNLDAFKCFIEDLKVLGNMNIIHGSFDSFQSQSAIQYLKRKGIQIEHISVDGTNEPYLRLIDLVMHGRLVCGKQIYVKNNMKSIQMTKRKGSGKMKIDHTPGEVSTSPNGTWETDTRGQNAKDNLDSITAAIEVISRYPASYIPYKVWKKNTQIDKSYEQVKAASLKFLEGMNLSL